MAVINQFSNPFGLGGGIYLSGSISASVAYSFVYYPITTTVANIKMNNITNGASITGSFSPGIPIYGTITQVTQSSGIAFVYSAIQDASDPAI